MGSTDVRGRDRNPITSYNRAAGLKVLLCAVAMGTMLASAAFPQVLEGTILLPDSLGPLIGANHVAFDEDSVHPRIFIGGEGGDVIVANAVTCERFARIRSGPMNALCYVPAHDKLYVSTTDQSGIAVVDCTTYEVIKRLPFASLATGLCYNPVVDRVYCVSDPLEIIDCSTDSLVGSLPMNATGAKCALDSVRNKLYVSAKDSLRVVDCSNDSVGVRLFGPRGAQSICFQPSTGKVYVAAGESLFALNTQADTVVYRQGFDTLYAQLACDPVHNRIYYTCRGHLIALDCAEDSMLWNYGLWARAISLAPVPGRDQLYMMLVALGSTWKYILDGSTGHSLRQFNSTGVEDSLYYNSPANRVFVTRHEIAVRAMKVGRDTVDEVLPLGAPIPNAAIDSTDNKLYFMARYNTDLVRIGVVDCVTSTVMSYSRVYEKARDLTYDFRDDKLYCSADSGIFVYDCRADTIVREIPIDGIPCELAWNPNHGKLYALAISGDTGLFMCVVDCSDDSITKTIDLNPTDSWGTGLMLPDLDQLWVFGGQTYTVIDCLNDSVVEYTTGSSFISASYDSSKRRIYASKWTHLVVIDVGSRLTIDSIPNPMRDTPNWESGHAYCATRADKVYWTLLHFLDADSVLVVDTRNDSVISGFSVPSLSDQACDDRTGDYVYFASDYVVAVDTRTDSVVSGVHLPLHASSLIPNRKTNRFYVAGFNPYDPIQVVYDSVVFAGVREAPTPPLHVARLQTIVSGGVLLRSQAGAELYDASGRRVAVFTGGLNDISGLAPGVYFVRGATPAESEKRQVVRKIVVAR